MEYFNLKSDPQWSGSIQIQELIQKIDKRKLDLEHICDLPNDFFFFILSEEEKYPDIIDQDLFLVSENMRHVLSMYQSDVIWKNVALLNRTNYCLMTYFLPIFPTIDCISDQSEWNRDHSILKNMVLSKSKIDGTNIFQIRYGISSHKVIVRLDVAESILRRDWFGITLESVKLEDNDYGT